MEAGQRTMKKLPECICVAKKKKKNLTRFSNIVLSPKYEAASAFVKL